MELPAGEWGISKLTGQPCVEIRDPSAKLVIPASATREEAKPRATLRHPAAGPLNRRPYKVPNHPGCPGFRYHDVQGLTLLTPD